MNKHKTQAITACAFIHHNRKLLIAKRAEMKKFLPGKYELPGGHVEFGESLEASLKRELKEELHIDITIENPFYTFTYLSDNDTCHNVEVDFFATMAHPDQHIILNKEDHSEYKWITEDEVDTYLPANDDETLAVKKGFALLNGHKTKSGIDYIGVGIGAVIFDKEGKIFLSKRGKKSRNEQGKWECPGGAMEFGDSFEDTIKREMKEEFDIDIEIIHQLNALNHRIPAEKQHWIAQGFICKIKQGIPKILEPEKSEAIGWFTIDEMKNMSLTIATTYRLKELLDTTHLGNLSNFYE